MLKLVRYLRGYGLECVLAPLFKCLEALFQLLVPLVMARVVDEGIALADRPLIWRYALVLVILGVVGWVSAAVAQYFSAKLAAGFGTAMRDDLFAHVMSLSRADVDEIGASTLVTRLTNDANQIQDGVNIFFRLVLRCPIAVGGTVVACFLVDGAEGAVFCVVAALVLLLVWRVMRVTVRGYRTVQRNLDGVLRRTAEQIEGIRVIHAFRREEAEREDFLVTSKALYERQVGVGDVAAGMNPMTYAVVNLGLMVVLYVGGISIDAGTLTQGALIALANYMIQMQVELMKLTHLVNMISKASACARRVNEVFARTPSMADGSVDAAGAEPTVEFRDVSFSYPGATGPALSEVSFSVSAGQTIGVIGGTGSGKTTLVNLVMRFYDRTSGQVLVGGRDVRDYRIESLRRLVSIVEQRPRLFAGTIAENLRWGDFDAGDDELLDCVGDAQATDVIESKGEGLAAVIEQGGRNLSGGQRQRLSIARTLARNSRVLILDDASSALDLATDAALRKALSSRSEGVTTFVVSQRVSALRHADLILVLDGGRLMGCGRHDELLRDCGVYREICESQLEDSEVIR